MVVSISQILTDKHSITARPGAKVECPFCGHKTFSIKTDDSLGKCFHPSCGRFITTRGSSKPVDPVVRALQDQLNILYLKFHQELLNQEDGFERGAYQYLVIERGVHPQVVTESMLGAVPVNPDLTLIIGSLKLAAAESEAKGPKIDVDAVCDKLRSCVEGHSGWLCFFYTDQYHRIIGIKFRQPYVKNFLHFKPLPNTGLFGRELFSQKRTGLCENLLVVEGEMNLLQLQSLAVKHAKEEGKEPSYVDCCAVGGVSTADLACVQAVCKSPTICCDNDNSGAGLKLVERAKEIMTVSAFTTPEVDSDLDNFIRSFGTNHTAAWNGIKNLIADRVCHQRSYESVAQEVFRTRQKRGGNDMRRDFEINTEVSTKIRDELLERGRFYHDHQAAYYFDNAEKKLIAIDRENTECVLLLHNFGINRTEGVFRYVVDDLWATARRLGTKTTAHGLTYYDQAKQTVHITNHKNGIYRVGLDNIDLVDNGTDGVLFLNNSKAEPFTLMEHNWRDSLLDRIVLSQVNFIDHVLLADEHRLMMRMWLLSIFFKEIMSSRPILAMIGDKGSGKTIVLRKLGAILFGSGFDVTPLPNKPEDFDAAVTNSEFVALDNADSKVKWLEDKMATVATGGSLKRRALYTTNTLVDYPVNCHLAITSRTPRFRRDDVADRLLIMPVKRYQNFAEADKIIKEVLTHRDQLMTEIILQVQEVLRSLVKYADCDDSSASRMADFGSFCMKASRGTGSHDQMADILARIPKEQSTFTLEGESFMDLLEEWISGHEGDEVTASDLCQQLSTLADDRGQKFFWKDNQRAFAQRISTLLPNLEQLFDVIVREGGSRKRFYKFSLKQEVA